MTCVCSNSINALYYSSAVHVLSYVCELSMNPYHFVFTSLALSSPLLLLG